VGSTASIYSLVYALILETRGKGLEYNFWRGLFRFTDNRGGIQPAAQSHTLKRFLEKKETGNAEQEWR
jgi:hypothetical protein